MCTLSMSMYSTVACLGLNLYCSYWLIYIYCSSWPSIPLLISSDSPSLISSCPCLSHHHHYTHAYIIIIFFLAYPFSQPQPIS
jgi:hypothetical protein